MTEILEAWDKELFLLLNGNAGPAMDWFMVMVSEKYFWLPLYVLFLWLIYRNYGVKGALLAILAVAVSVTMTDQSSVQLFKFQFERFRPCHNLELQGLFHQPEVIGCGGRFGFVSSHAANFFGVSTLIGLSLRHRYPRIMLWLYLWAGLIAYSRVYLAKHYPADILGGAILGILLGYLAYLGYRWALQRSGAIPARAA